MFHPRRFPRWASLFVAGAFLWGAGLQTTFAQSMFGNSGARSQTGGSSFGGAASAGGRGAATSRTNSTPGFSSSFAGSSLGGRTGLGGQSGRGGQAGQTGLAGPQMTTQLGQLSATAGQGFIGRADNAGRFVGNQVAGQQAIQGGNLGGLGGGQFGGRGGGGQFGRNTGGRNTGFNQNNQNNFNRQGGMQSRRMIRPRLQIAFESPARPTTQIQTSLNAQFTRLRTDRPELEDVQLQLGENQEVVLRGTVASEADSKLAAILARLEPGVRSIKNELTIEAE